MVYLVLGLTMMFGAGYAAAAVVAGNRLPHGTSVGGVGVGGLTPAAAVDALRSGLAVKAAEPFTVLVDGQPVRVTPRQAGLSVDYVASVQAAATTRSWSPDHVWGYYSGGEAHDPVVVLDQLRLAHLVKRLDREAGQPAVDGAVSFQRGTVSVRQPSRGKVVDLQQAADALTSAYLTGATTVDLPTVSSRPDIGARDVHRAVRRFANPALSDGVTLTFARTRVRLQPRDFAPTLGFRNRDGRLVPFVHRDRLRRVLDSVAVSHGTAQDAQIRIIGGHPVVVPGRPGARLSAAKVAPALLRVVRRPEGHRAIAVPARLTQPKFTTRDARRLHVKERIGSWTTVLPRGQSGHGDLANAVAALRGTLVKPGRTLSLDDRVPPYTSRSVSALGEALYNAALLGGLRVADQQSPRHYDGLGPVGRTVVVRWPSPDLRITDDTAHGVLVQTRLSLPTGAHEGSVTVTLWSTEDWDVRMSHSRRHHVEPAGVRIEHGKHCRPRSGQAGFDVDVTRDFRTLGSGDVDHTDTFTVHYAPRSAVRCLRTR